MGDPGDRHNFEERDGRSSPFTNNFGTINVYQNSSLQNSNPMGITQNNYGSGDNVAGDKFVGDKIMGDKVMGDKIMGDLNISQETKRVVLEIQALIIEQSDGYNLDSEKGKKMAAADTVEAIKANPTLKQRVIGALKEGGATANKKALNHPVAEVVVDTIKVFDKP